MVIPLLSNLPLLKQDLLFPQTHKQGLRWWHVESLGVHNNTTPCGFRRRTVVEQTCSMWCLVAFFFGVKVQEPLIWSRMVTESNFGNEANYPNIRVKVLFTADNKTDRVSGSCVVLNNLNGALNVQKSTRLPAPNLRLCSPFISTTCNLKLFY